MDRSNFLKASLEQFCINLSSDQLLSLKDSSDANTKLEFLSELMSCYENVSKECKSFAQLLGKKEWKTCLFSFLVITIICCIVLSVVKRVIFVIYYQVNERVQRAFL